MYLHPLYHWPPKSQWLEAPSCHRIWRAFAAYVHFPFCRNMCDFCGYETRLVSKDQAELFVTRAIAQIERHAAHEDFSEAFLTSVFFGGGTASLIPEHGLDKMLEVLRSWCRLPADSEVTLECEPGTISREKLRNAKSYGINRVSVCAQALDDKQLLAIGRKHTNHDSMQLIDDCLAVGISNIHIDLMYGLPEQTPETWERTLQKAITLPITHVSTYKLFVFKHGPLDRNNLLPRPKFETTLLTEKLALMHDIAYDILSSSGFRQYTLTEFARTGFESAYIRSCFNGSDVLPIGPGAFGKCAAEIWENSPYVHLYGDETASAEYHRAIRLSSAQAFKRDVILGLWLLSVSVEVLASQRHIVLGPKLGTLLNVLFAEDRIVSRPGQISLDVRHRFRAGEVMASLADLCHSEWVTLADNISSSGPGRSLPVSDNGMNTVLRMARRDPMFFTQLNRDPAATLSSLGYDLANAEVNGLVQTILNTPKLSVADGRVPRTWLAVMREQEHLDARLTEKHDGAPNT